QVDPALQPERRFDRLRLDGQRPRLRQVLLAALDGYRVLAGEQIDDERVGRERDVHLLGGRVAAAALAVLHPGAVRRGGAREVPGAVLAPDVDAGRQRLAGAVVESLAAQPHLAGVEGAVAPGDLVQASELPLDVIALVERQPAAQPLRLAGGAVGELGVRVQTRAFGVVPGAVARLPGGDDP